MAEINATGKYLSMDAVSPRIGMYIHGEYTLSYRRLLPSAELLVFSIILKVDYVVSPNLCIYIETSKQIQNKDSFCPPCKELCF